MKDMKERVEREKGKGGGRDGKGNGFGEQREEGRVN